MSDRNSPAPPATRSSRRKPRVGRSAAAWPAPAYSPMCSPRSMAITCRCTGRARSTPLRYPTGTLDTGRLGRTVQRATAPARRGTQSQCARWQQGTCRRYAGAGARPRRRQDEDRLVHAKPIVEQFFAWINQQFEAQGLLPSSPLTKALAYARARRFGLEVYLTDPDVPIDTNHLERGLRAIPAVARIGCSAGPNSGPSTSASCRA